MDINLIAFGIAKDILGEKTAILSLEDRVTVGSLKEKLIREYPAFEKLRSLSIAINEEYQTDDYEISPQDEVVIIPPVSGG
ncbi:MAG TPA: MoaD/ThiS family protein [Saprospiraceae bacterium]|nr:MoaD/ThiS family protein [Saprospiraceae bacterium]